MLLLYQLGMTIEIIFLSGSFTTCNAYFLGTSFFLLNHSVPFSFPRVWLGLLFFFGGLYINHISDMTLIKLKESALKEGVKYKIPKGGFFDYITAPNYFGEILEWTGFSIIAQSIQRKIYLFIHFDPAAYAFVLWTICNLVPRAFTHHKWYKTKFTNYPNDRRVIIPYLL